MFASLDDGARRVRGRLLRDRRRGRPTATRCRSASALYATEIEAELEGDAFFPELDPGSGTSSRTPSRCVENELGFAFRTYERARYNLDAARGAEQLARMRALEAEGVCIFCPEHVGRWQREPVEHEGEHWYVTRNDFPYEGTRRALPDRRPPPRAGLRGAARRGRRRAVARSAASWPRASARSRTRPSSAAATCASTAAASSHLHVHFVALEPDPAKTVRFRVSARGARASASTATRAPAEGVCSPGRSGTNEREREISR